MSLHILFVTSEVAPYSKSGGLGDVAGALPVALSRSGARVSVLSPWYASLAARPELVAVFNSVHSTEPVRVGRLSAHGVDYIFLGTPAFDRERYYGYGDDVERFARFCALVPQVAAVLAIQADVVHLNDWHTGLLAPILRLTPVSPVQARAKIVFTVHNLQYQGRWNFREVLAWAGLPSSVVHSRSFEFYGDANCLKAGLAYAHAVTTVSPTYAREIQTPAFGHGLDGVLRERGVRGILNGLDLETWNPALDPHLEHPYERFEAKRASRRSLVRELGLSAKLPILAVVSRLVEQKGIDLLLGALPAIADGWNLVVLGRGDSMLEGAFKGLSQLAQSRVAFRNNFDEAFAHRLYAGADALVMPSRFEPCGLVQMIAQRYGTVPIVHKTGGLADTVSEVTGYLFEEATSIALVGALERARVEWGTETFAARARAGMALEHSWTRAVGEYTALYQGLLRN